MNREIEVVYHLNSVQVQPLGYIFFSFKVQITNYLARLIFHRFHAGPGHLIQNWP